MSQLMPIQLEDGTLIYLEASPELDGLNGSASSQPIAPPGENLDTEVLLERGMTSTTLTKRTVENFRPIENTIRAYTQSTLNAFQHLAIANVEKVTLKFGVRISGEAGIPYITKGSAESNLEITVECKFPDSNSAKPGLSSEN